MRYRLGLDKYNEILGRSWRIWRNIGQISIDPTRFVEIRQDFGQNPARFRPPVASSKSTRPDLANLKLHTGLLGHMWFMLGIYVNILCSWLILWQNALYLKFGSFRMFLILQETCYSSLALKPWRLDQEKSEEKLFMKVGQIARHLRIDSSTDTIYREFKFSNLIFGPCLCICVGFLFS